MELQDWWTWWRCQANDARDSWEGNLDGLAWPFKEEADKSGQMVDEVNIPVSLMQHRAEPDIPTSAHDPHLQQHDQFSEFVFACLLTAIESDEVSDELYAYFSGFKVVDDIFRTDCIEPMEPHLHRQMDFMWTLQSHLDTQVELSEEQYACLYGALEEMCDRIPVAQLDWWLRANPNAVHNLGVVFEKVWAGHIKGVWRAELSSIFEMLFVAEMDWMDMDMVRELCSRFDEACDQLSQIDTRH